MVNIKLKWNKANFDVAVDPTQGVPALKNTIYGLTGVPIERQKLMAKGAWMGVLKDDADLTQAKIAENQAVMLMGTAEVVVKPTAPITFVEDM